MSRVDRPLSVIFCAVPAFNRVEPAIGSGPVSRKIGWWGLLQDRSTPIICNPDGQCTSRSRFTQARQCEGRCPTGGHRHENIVNINSVLTDELPCIGYVVLSSFHGLQQCVSSSRDQQQKPVVRPSKGGREFGPILHREASRCAGARVNEPTSLSQLRLHGNRGGSDGGESGPYGCYGRKLSFNQGFQDIRRFPTIYAGVAGAGFFGLHVNSRALRWCVNRGPATRSLAVMRSLRNCTRPWPEQACRTSVRRHPTVSSRRNKSGLLMATELREAPDAVRRQSETLARPLTKLAALLRNSPPRLVVTCARGSSANAATFGKYLIERHLGIPVADAAPSIMSVYRRELDARRSALPRDLPIRSQ